MDWYSHSAQISSVGSGNSFVYSRGETLAPKREQRSVLASGETLGAAGSFRELITPGQFRSSCPGSNEVLLSGTCTRLGQGKRHNVIPQLDPLHLAMPTRCDHHVLAAAHACSVRHRCCDGGGWHPRVP